jgi:hypothetical protein
MVYELSRQDLKERADSFYSQAIRNKPGKGIYSLACALYHDYCRILQTRMVPKHNPLIQKAEREYRNALAKEEQRHDPAALAFGVLKASRHLTELLNILENIQRENILRERQER